MNDYNFAIHTIIRTGFGYHDETSHYYTSSSANSRHLVPVEGPFVHKIRPR